MIQMYSTGVGIFIGFAGRVEKRIFLENNFYFYLYCHGVHYLIFYGHAVRVKINF